MDFQFLFTSFIHYFIAEQIGIDSEVGKQDN